MKVAGFVARREHPAKRRRTGGIGTSESHDVVVHAPSLDVGEQRGDQQRIDGCFRAARDHEEEHEA